MHRKSFARRFIAVIALIAASAGHAQDEALAGQFTVSAVGAGNSGVSVTRFAAHTPAVAIDPESQHALVVWSADDANFRTDGMGACEAKTEALCLANDEFEIFGAIRQAGGQLAVTAPFRISVMGDDEEEDAEIRARFAARNPAVAWNPVAEEFLVAWEADDDSAPLVDGEFEIYGQRVGPEGELRGERIRISVMGDESETDAAERANYDAFEPAIAVDAAGNYLVVWRADHDETPLVNDEYEIFGRLVSAEGELQGEQFRISFMGDDAETVAAERRKFGAYEPDVAFNPVSGNFVVVWRGEGNQDGLVQNEHEVFAQEVASADGALVGSRLRISHMGPDGNPDFDAFAPAISLDPASGTMLIVWHGDDQAGVLGEGEIEVYGRMLDAGMTFLGQQFRISIMGHDGEPDPAERIKFRGEHAAVAWSTDEAEFLVTWQGDTNAAPLVDDEFEIFARRIQLNGSMNPRFRVSVQGEDDEKDADERRKHAAVRPAVDYGAGNFYVTWSGGKSGYHQIRGRRFASQHTQLGLRLEQEKIAFASPEPIAYLVRVTNRGDVTAENVRVRIRQTENFPVSFERCESVEGEFCVLGDIEPEEEISARLLLGTEHFKLGAPQRSDVTVTVMADTALAGVPQQTVTAMASVSEKGGSGAFSPLWLMLLAGVPLFARRR